MGSRGGVRSGNGTGLTTLQVPNTSGSAAGMNATIVRADGIQYDEGESTDVVISSEAESESGDEEDIGSSGDRRGVKRERAEMEVGTSAGKGLVPGSYGTSAGGTSSAKPGKKTRGRVKIKMEFIDNKLRRYTTFSKRKTGIMKKAYELSTLTGTQVLLLVASETGHVYTFATRKLQPMITSETGKALIQTCLNSPETPSSASGNATTMPHHGNTATLSNDPSAEQRMSATGFEETELSYQVIEPCASGADSTEKSHGSTSTPPSSSSSSSSPPLSLSLPTSGAPCWPAGGSVVQSANGGVLKSVSTHNLVNAHTQPTPVNPIATTAGVVLPPGFTLMSGTALPPGTHTIPLSSLALQPVPAPALTAPHTHTQTLQTLPSAALQAALATSVHTSTLTPPAFTLTPAGLTLQQQGVGLPSVAATTATVAIPTPQVQPPQQQHQHQQQTVAAQTFLRLPATVSLTGTALPQQLQLQVQSSSQQGGGSSSTPTTGDSSSISEVNHSTISPTVVSQSTAIITSSSASATVPAATAAATGHMMYPGQHTVMYAAPTQTLGTDGSGSLTLLNPFPPPSHSQASDSGPVPQMFLTGPQGTVQIPVSAVPLHSMLIGAQPVGGTSSNLTELRVVSLDSTKTD